MPDSNPVRAYAVLPQRGRRCSFCAVSGKRRGKECVGRPAIPAHLIETNTVTSVLYDEQINLVSTFFKFAAAAAH